MTAPFAIAIHDVAPSWLGEVLEWRALIADRTPPPVGLYLVPRFHLERWSKPQVEAVIGLIADGDEPVLHGYTHMRTGLDDEREFRGLDDGTANRRVQAGLIELAARGIRAEGFAAPCYSGHAERLLRSPRSPLAWTATRTALHSRHGSVRAPAIGVGASTPMRRWLSPPSAKAVLAGLPASQPFRIDVHPADLRHPRLRQAVLDLVDRAIARNGDPVRHADLVARVPLGALAA